MIAVDSSVLAYLLIDNRQTADARALPDRDTDWHRDVFARVELTNALAAAMRLRRLDLARANRALAEAQGVIEQGLHAVSHGDALAAP
jgi:predicted nucleic acid-binding protein